MAPSKDDAPVSSRYSNLKKSFHLGARSILTAFSKDDVNKAFSTFNDAERRKIYQMFVQVITSLHGIIEEEFESVCQERKVGVILHTIEQLVEEQNLDNLSTTKTNVGDVKEEILIGKREEIQYLTDLLEKAEDQNSILIARINTLKEMQQKQSVTAAVGEKLRSWNSNLGEFNRN